MLEEFSILTMGPDMDWENSDRLLTDIEKQGNRDEERSVTPFNITVTVGSGGTATPTSAVGYPYKTIYINIVPEEGYWISRIVDNEQESSHWFSGLLSYTYLLYNVSEDHDIKIEFDKYQNE